MNLGSIPHCWASCASGFETEDIKVPCTEANKSLWAFPPTVSIAIPART
jgi:hypothetical protein